jgi:hypothetical protein
VYWRNFHEVWSSSDDIHYFDLIFHAFSHELGRKVIIVMPKYLDFRIVDGN